MMRLTKRKRFPLGFKFCSKCGNELQERTVILSYNPHTGKPNTDSFMECGCCMESEEKRKQWDGPLLLATKGTP